MLWKITKIMTCRVYILGFHTHDYSQVSAVCSWDSSIHDSIHLNRITVPNERIYLIVKATVQLSHPASMELVLRKRIAVNIYNKQVWKSLCMLTSLQKDHGTSSWSYCALILPDFYNQLPINSQWKSLKSSFMKQNG